MRPTSRSAANIGGERVTKERRVAFNSGSGEARAERLPARARASPPAARRAARAPALISSQPRDDQSLARGVRDNGGRRRGLSALASHARLVVVRQSLPRLPELQYSTAEEEARARAGRLADGRRAYGTQRSASGKCELQLTSGRERDATRAHSAAARRPASGRREREVHSGPIQEVRGDCGGLCALSYRS